MKRLRLFRLGLRLATAGGRAALVRLGLMAVGFSIGAGLLLSALSIVPAFHVRDKRTYAYGEQVRQTATSDVLRTWYVPQQFGDVRVDDVTVAQGIGHAPVPPGLPRVPGPGEIFVSEALRELWSGPLGAALESRLRGHLAGTIAPDDVPGPDALAMWVGKPADVRLPLSEAFVVKGFGNRPSAVTAPDLGRIVISLAVACAIVLPIWLFVATATRLSAATRESRLAAVRLAGGTESQVRVLAGVEAGIAAAVGTLFGIPMFIAFRPVLAGGPLGCVRFYPTDLSPPRGLAVAVLLALPAIAVLMTLGTMRRLIVSPLGVARKARRSHAGWRWVPVLVLGIGLLAWGARHHAELKRWTDGEVRALIVGGLVCTALGLVGTATWAAWAVAGLIARSARSVPVMLGMRRLESEPSSVSRVVAGVALMIVLVGVVQSGFAAVEREGPFGLSLARWTEHFPSSAVIVSWNQRFRPPYAATLQQIPGVHSITLSHVDPHGARGTYSMTAALRTDGSSATLETVRDRVAWTGTASTLGQLREEAAAPDPVLASIRRGVMTLTMFLLLVSAATLLVAMVDWVMERRRSIAVLSAVGVQGRTIRRSILMQVALPLGIAATLGLAGGGRGREPAVQSGRDRGRDPGEATGGPHPCDRRDRVARDRAVHTLGPNRTQA